MTDTKIGDTVWFVAGVDDRPYTVTGFCFDDLRGVTMVELDGTCPHKPMHCTDLENITKVRQ